MTVQEAQQEAIDRLKRVKEDAKENQALACNLVGYFITQQGYLVHLVEAEEDDLPYYSLRVEGGNELDPWLLLQPGRGKHFDDYKFISYRPIFGPKSATSDYEKGVWEKYLA